MSIFERVIDIPSPIGAPRVDHLYTFFVQWSPDLYGKSSPEPGFIVVQKEELDAIGSLLGDPAPKSREWSPYLYGKSSPEPGFIVVQKEELDAIGSLLGDPAPKSREVSAWPGVP
ncbi:hypothetical protein AAFF_G00162720 [Aldrovandia affinis]|uniref:Uncharacterized protein n=1 Tax=Aldrovandia affinis TaxID=143900 RepID=A0AAD7WX32_9TELE|nr:hypothetical protein AAFF_G00162720 [Aldrovandia affinis]